LIVLFVLQIGSVHGFVIRLPDLPLALFGACLGCAM